MAKTEKILSKLEESIQLFKSQVRSSLQWRKLLKLPASKNVQVKSAFEMLVMTDCNVTTDMLVAALPDHFGHLADDPILLRRLQVRSCVLLSCIVCWYRLTYGRSKDVASYCKQYW